MLLLNCECGWEGDREHAEAPTSDGDAFRCPYCGKVLKVMHIA